MKALHVLVFGLFLATAAPATNFISPRETARLVADGRAILVDVREADEIKETRMAEPALWMPMSAVEAETTEYRKFVANLPQDKLIVVYCRSGRRSQIFIDKHAALPASFGNMGGFSAWKEAGLPVRPL